MESAQQIQPVKPEITASPPTSTSVENIDVITDPVQQETETEATSNPILSEGQNNAVSSYPVLWSISESRINYLVSKEIDQNLNEDFSMTTKFCKAMKKNRSLTKDVFVRKMKNGQKVSRKYLCYSPSKRALFCIPC